MKNVYDNYDQLAMKNQVLLLSVISVVVYGATTPQDHPIEFFGN